MPRTKKAKTGGQPPVAAASAERRSELKGQLAAMGKVASRIEGFRPAHEVLEHVQAVPTIFPSINWGTRVGGWPTKRVAVVHGPSNHGKTAFALGLLKSYLQRDHFAGLVDAEFTTPFDWVEKLLAGYARHPGFVAKYPESYEDTVTCVRSFADTIYAAKEDGELLPDTTSLVVVDSLQKLVPERLMEKLEKEEGGIDGMSGRAAMYQAALNSQWLKELNPKLFHTDSGIVLINREMQQAKKMPWEDDYKLLGGNAVVLDSSIIARVSRAAWIKQKVGKKEIVVGEKHKVIIHKTKVGAKDDKNIECYFHTSNGQWVPEGFDIARDYLDDIGQELGVIERRGSVYAYQGEVIGRGIGNAVKTLTGHREWLDRIAGDCRTEFEKREPKEAT